LKNSYEGSSDDEKVDKVGVDLEALELRANRDLKDALGPEFPSIDSTSEEDKKQDGAETKAK